MVAQNWLEHVYGSGLQEMEEVRVKMTFQTCQIDQLGTQFENSLTFNLDSSVWGVGTEGINLETASRVDYLHRCA